MTSIFTIMGGLVLLAIIASSGSWGTIAWEWKHGAGEAVGRIVGRIVQVLFVVALVAIILYYV